MQCLVNANNKLKSVRFKQGRWSDTHTRYVLCAGDAIVPKLPSVKTNRVLKPVFKQVSISSVHTPCKAEKRQRTSIKSTNIPFPLMQERASCFFPKAQRSSIQSVEALWRQTIFDRWARRRPCASPGTMIALTWGSRKRSRKQDKGRGRHGQLVPNKSRACPTQCSQGRRKCLLSEWKRDR